MDSSPAHVTSPYKGLVPYSEEDAQFFFGRESDRRKITSNLKASRVTLLYGASGVGKSSVLRAGVIHHLRSQATKSLRLYGDPGFLVVEFSAWRDDPIVGLESSIRSEVDRLYGSGTMEPLPSSESLTELIAGWNARLGVDLLFVFDQFEEFFLYHGQEEGQGTFAFEFPRAVEDRQTKAGFLIAIREDAYTQLDRFKASIPNLFVNTLRIDHLDREAARSAIVKPIERFNEINPEDEPVVIEPELVAQVLDDVRSGQISLGHAGKGVVDHEEDSADRIEAPYLQLVIDRLWLEEMRQGSRVLRLVTLEQLGGATRIVSTHLDEAMSALSQDEREIAANVFDHLVTPGGNKIAHTLRDLAHYAGVPEERLLPVVEGLAHWDVRILRAVPSASGVAKEGRYEIFHDVLADPILDWQTRYAVERERQARAQAERKSRRKLTRVWALAAAGMLLSLAFLAIGIWALQQKRQADAQLLTARAVSSLGTNPQRSVQLSLGAVETKDSASAEAILRQSLEESRVRVILTGHTGIVWTASFNHDGTRIVTASDDKSAKVWDAVSGAMIATFPVKANVNHAWFSPTDSDVVLSLSDDWKARMWHVSDPKHPLVLPAQDDAIYSASISPDGRWVFGGGADGIGRLWSFQTGQQMRTFGTGSWITATAFSANGDQMAAARGLGGVSVWDRTTGRQQLSLRTTKDVKVDAVAFSPDGRFIAAGNDAGHIWLWDAASGSLIRTWWAYANSVGTTAFNSTSTLLLTSGAKYADVFDASTGAFRARMDAKSSWVDSARFNPDGTLVVTANQDGTARVFVARTGGQLRILRGHDDIVWDAEFGPGGSRVVTSSEDRTARVWYVAAGRYLWANNGPTAGATFNEAGTMVATVGVGGSAALWDATTGRMLHALPSDGDLWGTSFSPDGKLLAAASQLGDVLLYRTDDGQEWTPASPCCFEPGSDTSSSANGVEFSPSGSRLAVLYGDQTLWSWTVNPSGDGSVSDPKQIGGSKLKDVVSAAWSPDGTTIATAIRSDKSVRFWDVATGRETGKPLRGSRGLINSLAWSKHYVLTAGTDGVVRLWNPDTGRVLEEFAPPTTVAASDVAAISPDEKRVAAGGNDGAVTVWEVGTGWVLAVLHPHPSYINSIEFGPDGRVIVTSSDDGTANLATCTTCQPLDQLKRWARRQIAIGGS